MLRQFASGECLASHEDFPHAEVDVHAVQ
jgi:hypothetical protein